jgi:hypothetical protein
VLSVGLLLRLHARDTFRRSEVVFALIAILLAFWHPFATALFMGFYFGYCLENFHQRSRFEQVRAAGILMLGAVTVFVLVSLFSRAEMGAHSRLLGFLTSYRTNEVNSIASFCALLLTQVALMSFVPKASSRLVGGVVLTALAVLLWYQNLPVLFLWFGVVLIKLFRLRYWSIFFMMATAAILPFGGGIGTPIYCLFGIIIAVYATVLEWPQTEAVLSFLAPRYAVGIVGLATIVLVAMRIGVDVPVVSRLAKPLLVERERTYQLENALAWLHNSQYCGYEIDFKENAGSPIDSTENVITRSNRPPAALEDVQYFWDNILRCRDAAHVGPLEGKMVLTFGGPVLENSNPVFVVNGKYAGDAVVWVKQTQSQ